VLAPLLRREGVGGGADEDADGPGAAPGVWSLEVVPGPDRSVPTGQELELENVVRPGGQELAGARLGPLGAVDHDVDLPGAELLEQAVPLSLRELGLRAQVAPERAHELDLETGDVSRRIGVGIGVRAAAFLVTAVAQRPLGLDSGQRISSGFL